LNDGATPLVIVVFAVLLVASVATGSLPLSWMSETTVVAVPVSPGWLRVTSSVKVVGVVLVPWA